jgi:hypothetical protein
MTFARLALAGTAAWLLAPWAAHASTADDRIAVSADGATLKGPASPATSGGGGSLGWLHNFDADSLLGIAGEYQAIGAAHWTFGSLNASKTFGPADQRYTVYGEVHEGRGNDGKNPFDYSIEAIGVAGTYFRSFSAQLEDKQINVQTTHGNLPKVVVSYLWNPHFQTQASYSHSISGNVGTHLTTARIDGYGAALDWFVGVAFGQASAAILLPVSSSALGAPQGSIPARQLHEGYVGVSKPFRNHSELTVIADYQNLAGTKHATLTVNYIFHVGHTGTVR